MAILRASRVLPEVYGDVPVSMSYQMRARHLLRSVLSGEKSDEAPPYGSRARIVTLNDGVKAVRKSVDFDAEILAPMVGDVMGAGAPAVVEVGKAIYMEFVRGAVAAEDPPAKSEALSTPRARRIAAMDQIIGNQDRHDGNWIVDPAGEPVPIDHGWCFWRGSNARPGAVSGGAFWRASAGKMPAFDADEWAMWAARLEELRGVFASRERGDWHAAMMAQVRHWEGEARKGRA